MTRSFSVGSAVAVISGPGHVHPWRPGHSFKLYLIYTEGFRLPST